MWWHGPSWLQENDKFWPVKSPSHVIPEFIQQPNSEMRKSNVEVSHVTVDKGKWLLFGIDPSQYSSLRKLLRVSIFVLRFIKTKIWNRINPSQRKLIQQNKLLTAILTSGGGARTHDC